MVAGVSRDELVSGLVHIGELEITGEGQAEVETYFAPDFKLHGQDGRESVYECLQANLAPFVRLSTTSPGLVNRRRCGSESRAPVNCDGRGLFRVTLQPLERVGAQRHDG